MLNMEDGNLSIAIVGAGLAGLLAALKLGQDGHSIKLYERRATLSPRGGGIMIRSNATRQLISWGLQDDFARVTDDFVSGTVRELVSGRIIQDIPVDRYSDFPTWGVIRQDVQRMLFEKVRGMDGVQMRFGVEVAGVSDSNDGLGPTLTLGDGEVVEADLIIVADGIRSRLRDTVLADVIEETGPVKPLVSPLTTYQTKLPYEDVKRNDAIKDIIPAPGTIVWRGDGRHAVTAGGDKMNICIGDFVVREDLDVAGSEDEGRLWEENGDIEHVRTVYKGANPLLVGWLDTVKTCNRWKLAEMPNLRRWTSDKGRIILLGDSAHAMLPGGAQGVSQIIEDIAVLSYLLSKMRDQRARAKYVHDILPLITKTWQDVRKARFDRVKQYCEAFRTSLQARPRENEKSNKDKMGDTGDLESTGELNSLSEKHGNEKGNRSGMDTDFTSDEFSKWLLDRDVLEGLDAMWQEKLAISTDYEKT